MGTISAIPFRYRRFKIAGVCYDTAGSVPLRVWMMVLVAMVVAKLEKRRTRIQLSELSADQLKDIGLTTHQADAEIRKSLLFFERLR